LSLNIVPFEREHLDAVMDLGDAERENLLMYDLLGRTCMDDGQTVCLYGGDATLAGSGRSLGRRRVPDWNENIRRLFYAGCAPVLKSS
jgi:hypothetical protein